MIHDVRPQIERKLNAKITYWFTYFMLIEVFVLKGRCIFEVMKRAEVLDVYCSANTNKLLWWTASEDGFSAHHFLQSSTSFVWPFTSLAVLGSTLQPPYFRFDLSSPEKVTTAIVRQVQKFWSQAEILAVACSLHNIRSKLQCDRNNLVNPVFRLNRTFYFYATSSSHLAGVRFLFPRKHLCGVVE